MLTEAEMVEQPAAETPSPSYNNGYEPVKTPDLEVGQAEKQTAEAYLIDALLNRAWEVFAYVVDEVLYQYVNKPEGIQAQFINYVINVNEKKLTINMTNEEKNFGLTPKVIDETIKMYEMVLKKRLKTKFKVTTADLETITMGRADCDKLMSKIDVEIVSPNAEDLLNPGDADYFNRVADAKTTEVSNEVEVKP